MVYVIVAIIAYLIGSISFSVIFGKKIAGIDVREKGSKNAGATNVLRTAGKKAAILTLICDVLKGIFAVLVAYFATKIFSIESGDVLVQIAAVAVVIGHMFPIFFQFKGGKGIATSLGILLIVNWQIGLICLVFALVSGDSYLILGIILAALVIYNHRTNIQRLMNGTENKISFK